LVEVCLALDAGGKAGRDIAESEYTERGSGHDLEPGRLCKKLRGVFGKVQTLADNFAKPAGAVGLYGHPDFLI